jgi:hypothetical protein
MGVPARNTFDDGEVRSDDWFAKQLGDGWHTSGDGIYTYVGEPSDPSDTGVPNDDERSDSASRSGHSLKH